jgi:hypothetical protein
VGVPTIRHPDSRAADRFPATGAGEPTGAGRQGGVRAFSGVEGSHMDNFTKSVHLGGGICYLNELGMTLFSTTWQGLQLPPGEPG